MAKQEVADPLIAAITAWIKSAPAPVRALLTQQSANVTQPKASKSDVNYRPADDPAESCSTCTNFDGTGGCAVVSGAINPSYVSDRFSGGEDVSASEPTDAGEGDQPPE